MTKPSSSRSFAVMATVLSSLGAHACSGDGGSDDQTGPGGRATGGAASYGGNGRRDAGTGGALGRGGTSSGGDGSGGKTDSGVDAATGGGQATGGTADAGGASGAGGADDGGTTGDAEAPDGAGPSDGALPPLTCSGPGPRFATRVVSSAFGPGQDLGRDQLPEIVLGPPKGMGSTQGSFDVAALGDGGSITLAFDGNAIVDGPGADFIVFENAFNPGGDPNNPYAELGTVAVSNDGTTWTSFTCTANAFPYDGCAGWHPVYANADTNTIDPTDPSVAGGDAFDLAAIGVSSARFVRITDRADLATVFDLDAVAIVHGKCE